MSRKTRQVLLVFFWARHFLAWYFLQIKFLFYSNVERVHFSEVAGLQLATVLKLKYFVLFLNDVKDVLLYVQNIYFAEHLSTAISVF